MSKRNEPEKSARPWLLGFALAAMTSALAGAQELTPQPPKQQGGFFVPMLSVGQTLDSNLFFTQFPESDFVTRLNFGLQTGYRSTPFTIDLQASRAADRFARNKDFDTDNARTIAQVTMNAQASKSIALSLFACYLDTKTPGELNLISGLGLGRSMATRASVTPAVELRLGSRSTFIGAFPIAHDTLDGRVADTMTATAVFDRRISRRDSVSFRYEHRWFDFTGGDKTEKSTANVFMLGWLGEVSDRTIVLLRAGPRYAKGAYTAEILATMKRRLNRGGLLTLSYSKSQATTLGKTGALDIQSLVATVATRVSRKFELASGPGIYRNSLRGKNLHALRLNVESLWHFSPWFHLGASYSFDLQQPDFGASGKIRRSAMMVRVITSKEQRRPEDPTSEPFSAGTP